MSELVMWMHPEVAPWAEPCVLGPLAGWELPRTLDPVPKYPPRSLMSARGSSLGLTVGDRKIPNDESLDHRRFLVVTILLLDRLRRRVSTNSLHPIPGRFDKHRNRQIRLAKVRSDRATRDGLCSTPHVVAYRVAGTA